MSRLLEHKQSLPSSELANSRTVSVIRPPSFSLKTIFSGIKTLFAHRDLLLTLTLFRLTVRYKQSMLGWVWAALQPLAMMLTYTFVFSRMAHVAIGEKSYPLFVFAALLPWNLFSGAVSNAINGLVAYSDVLTKLHFPREIIPLSYVLAALVDFAIAFGILNGLMMYYHTPLDWRALYALPAITILIGFASAVALFLSSVQVRFRDVGAALPLVLQIGLFTTPVVYPLTSVHDRFRTLYLLNPVASLIECFRRAVLRGPAPAGSMLLSSGVVTLCCLALAYAYFKATEANMSDVI